MKFDSENTNKKILPIVAGLLLVAVGILPFILSSKNSSFDEVIDKNISEVKVLPATGITEASGSNLHSQTTTSPPTEKTVLPSPSLEEKDKQQHIEQGRHSASSQQVEPDKNMLAPHTQDSQSDVSHSTNVNEQIVAQQLAKEHVEGVAENVSSDKVCYEFGPVLSDIQKSELETTLHSHGIMSTLQFKNVQRELGYWVFLPPQRSVAIGRLKVEEIKLKGIKDVSLLVNHEPKLAISLGIFKDEKNANARMLKAQSFGFDAKMDLRHIEENQMWLVLEGLRQNDLPEQEWAHLLKRYSPIELKTINCP